MSPRTTEIAAPRPAPRISPILGLWAGVFITGFAATLVIAAGTPALVTATYRLLFASLALVPYVLIKGREDFKKLSASDLGYAILTGAAFGLHIVSYIAALTMTSVASAAALASLQPVFVALGSVLFLREQVPTRVKVGIAFALVGGAIVGGADLVRDGLGKSEGPIGFAGLSGPLVGDLAAVGAGLAFSGYLLLGRRLRQKLDFFPYLFIVFSSAAVLVGSLSLALGTDLLAVPPMSLLYLALLGVGCTVVGYGFWNWALAYVPAPTVSVLVLAGPVVETILAFLILGIVPALTSVIGGAVILAGTVLTSMPQEEAAARRARRNGR